MKYGILQISDTNYPTIQTVAGNKFSLTLNSEIEMDKGDRVLGYWSTNPKKFIMVLEVAEKSTLNKVYLSKIFEIPLGIGIEDSRFLTKINTGFSSNKNLLEITKEEFDTYEQKLLSLLGVGKKNKPISNIIPHSHNRIVFGTPGTGKSNRLLKDSNKYFNNNESDLYTQILKEIKDLLAKGKDMQLVAMTIGLKYMYFFASLMTKMSDVEISTKIGITDDILGGHARQHLYQPAKTLSNVNGYINYETIERVTFHPNYSYAQFVGTYKPVTINTDVNLNITKEQQGILNILKDTTKTGQEKYDLLYESFKQSNLTRLPLLLGIYTDDDFKTKKADGSPASNDNDVERNHGRAIRPYVSIQEKNSKNEIAYEFVPGPFIRTYIKAKKTGQNVLLLIEEINRANVAAVFGDVFQLLDRDANGNSEYPITTSEDLRNFLARPENLGGTPDDYKTLSIPSNMYIWATMNSADQGVFPMDTAFKRRWEFEYIGIDENEKKVENFYIPISENKKVKWNDLRKAINDKLIELGINEDKLLGPFFLNKTILENAMNKDSNFIKSFESKVLMYLFEDAAKMKVRQLFNLQDNRYIYSEICKKFEKEGLAVFNFEEDSKVMIKNIESASQPANGALF